MKSSRLITIVALSAALFILVWRFAPPKALVQVSKSIGPVADLICKYPVQVRGNGMTPIFHDGQRITLSRRIEDPDNIPVGTIILYERPGGMRLSVIRERVIDANGVDYRVSQEARRQEIDEVRSDRIIATYFKSVHAEERK